MPDTDSKMMRRQQDKDTPQHIEEDETAAHQERHDSDPASGAARETATRGNTLEENPPRRPSFEPGEQKQAAAAGPALYTDPKGRESSLVRAGRSLLGQ